MCRKAPPAQKRTQSVRKGIPTRSMGTIVFSRAPLVPHAPAWECRSWRSASALGAAPRSMGTMVFFRTAIVPHAPAWECRS
ncbi:hypothetical protein B1F74_16030 [Pseudomonas syringae]|nr:hypothetical protein B1F74_16030 [Pseudomonas syringae]